MSNNAKEEAQALIEKLSPHLPIWHKYDSFMIAFMNKISVRMHEANEKLLSTIQEAFVKKGGVEALTDQINENLKANVKSGSTAGIEQIQKILAERGALDSDLKALLGIVHYNVLLQKRLDTFKGIAEKVSNLTQSEIDPANAKRLLIKYGPGLALVWKDCEPLCRSVFERDLLKKTAESATAKNKSQKAAGMKKAS